MNHLDFTRPFRVHVLGVGLAILLLTACQSSEHSRCCRDSDCCAHAMNRERDWGREEQGAPHASQDRRGASAQPRRGERDPWQGAQGDASPDRPDLDRDFGNDRGDMHRDGAHPSSQMFGGNRDQHEGRGEEEQARRQHEQEDRIHLEIHERLDRLNERLAELERRLDGLGDDRRAVRSLRPAGTR